MEEKQQFEQESLAEQYEKLEKNIFYLKRKVLKLQKTVIATYIIILCILFVGFITYL